jgi:hypothetical protein
MEDIILHGSHLLFLLSGADFLEDLFKVKPAQLTILMIIDSQDTPILVMDILLLLNSSNKLGRFLKREKFYFALSHYPIPQTEKGEMDSSTRLLQIIKEELRQQV